MSNIKEYGESETLRLIKKFVEENPDALEEYASSFSKIVNSVKEDVVLLSNERLKNEYFSEIIKSMEKFNCSLLENNKRLMELVDHCLNFMSHPPINLSPEFPPSEPGK